MKQRPGPTTSLEVELKQGRPFESPEAEVVVNLLRTHNIVSGQLALVLKTHDLSLPLYNILRILRGAGDEGLCVQDITDRMITREPDTTRLLDRLEKLDYATRTRSKVDRRVVLVRITGAGRDALTALDAPLRKAQKELVGHLSRSELADLNRLLSKARERGVG